ncbi:hypothetical protein RHMOL_Rhmol05G0008100 [Rhododendron molle]|uniref:Uncharacterized protein n=1 Tax=Rhododendron molle TaxID=49168 RepID=A0ACC0NKL0_RHOML|nr:hypothetical protein RHMOL_Rhmol05G0008100 [Rhododendron molle]
MGRKHRGHGSLGEEKPGSAAHQGRTGAVAGSFACGYSCEKGDAFVFVEDLASDLVKRHPQLALAQTYHDNDSGLGAIARNVKAFPSDYSTHKADSEFSLNGAALSEHPYPDGLGTDGDAGKKGKYWCGCGLVAKPHN